jgi:hypothetical protein
MTVNDRLREASEATRTSFAAQEVPELRPGGRMVSVSVALLLVVAVVGVALTVGLTGDESQVTADGGRDPSATDRSQETTSTTTPTTARDLSAGDASLLDPGPLSPRGGHSVVWSGSEVIVWGGWGDENGSVKHADGAAYELSTGGWRRIAAGPLEPRGNHAAAWTGSEMIIVGGDGRTDSAAYDPVADSWRQLPPAPFPIAVDEYLDDEGRAVTDSALYIWDVDQDQVARYDFAAGRWDQSPGPGFDDVTVGALQVVGSDLVALGAVSSTRSPLQVASADLSVGSWQRLPDGPVDQYGNPFNPRSSVGLDRVLIAWQAGPGQPEATLALNLGTGEWQSRSPHELPACEGWWAPQEIDDGLLASSCGVTVRYQASQDAWQQVDIGELEVNGRDTVWTGSEIMSWGATCCYGTGGSPFQPNVAWSYTPPP